MGKHIYNKPELWDKNDRLLPQVNGSRIWTQEELECIILSCSF